MSFSLRNQYEWVVSRIRRLSGSFAAETRPDDKDRIRALFQAFAPVPEQNRYPVEELSTASFNAFREQIFARQIEMIAGQYTYEDIFKMNDEEKRRVFISFDRDARAEVIIANGGDDPRIRRFIPDMLPPGNF